LKEEILRRIKNIRKIIKDIIQELKYFKKKHYNEYQLVAKNIIDALTYSLQEIKYDKNISDLNIIQNGLIDTLRELRTQHPKNNSNSSFFSVSL
jgi:hypothetical protein